MRIEISDAELGELEHDLEEFARYDGELAPGEMPNYERRADVNCGQVLSLVAALRSTREQRELAEDRLRSVCAWAKNARHPKISGLPPSRALRWIDELGDRLFPITEEPTE